MYCLIPVLFIGLIQIGPSQIFLTMRFFKKKPKASAPLIVIKKDAEDTIKEYNSIEEAIKDLEKDPNISTKKIGKLRDSLKNLKNKNTIKISNGEIIK